MMRFGKRERTAREERERRRAGLTQTAILTPHLRPPRHFIRNPSVLHTNGYSPPCSVIGNDAVTLVFVIHREM